MKTRWLALIVLVFLVSLSAACEKTPPPRAAVPAMHKAAAPMVMPALKLKYKIPEPVAGKFNVAFVYVGPIGDGEHTAGEWVDVASVKVVARVLEAAARRYCA